MQARHPAMVSPNRQTIKLLFIQCEPATFLALQALVFALVTAAFTNIYITQPAIVIFVSIMLLLPFISGIFETQKENSMEKKSLSKSSKTEIKEMNIVAKRVAFLY